MSGGGTHCFWLQCLVRSQVTELSETLCMGPPQLLIACGADAADIDAMEADEQAMAATCRVCRQAARSRSSVRFLDLVTMSSFWCPFYGLGQPGWGLQQHIGGPRACSQVGSQSGTHRRG